MCKICNDTGYKNHQELEAANNAALHTGDHSCKPIPKLCKCRSALKRG